CRPPRSTVPKGTRAADRDRGRAELGGPSVSSEFVRGLKCRLCGKLYPKEALNFCTEDFGPLEVEYDYEAIGRALSREAIARRPRTMWRYKELLPIDGEPTVGLQVG